MVSIAFAIIMASLLRNGKKSGKSQLNRSSKSLSTFISLKYIKSKFIPRSKVMGNNEFLKVPTYIFFFLKSSMCWILTFWNLVSSMLPISKSQSLTIPPPVFPLYSHMILNSSSWFILDFKFVLCLFMYM